MDKVKGQKKLVVASETGRLGHRPLGLCTGGFSIQWGIPCAHQLVSKLINNGVLIKTDFHPFWWLDRNLAEEIPVLRFKEPDVVRVLKGRPRGNGPFAGSTSILHSDLSLPFTAPAALMVSATPSASNQRPVKPSARRNRSLWESEDTMEVEGPVCGTRKTRNAPKITRKRRATATKSAPTSRTTDVGVDTVEDDGITVSPQAQGGSQQHIIYIL